MAEPSAAASASARHPRHWLGVGVFIIVSMALAWLIALPLWWRTDLQNNPVAFQVTAMVMMFSPTIAALVVLLLVERTGWRAVVGRLGINFGTRSQRTLWVALGTIVAFMVACCVLIPLVAWLLGAIQVDWSMPALTAQLEAAGAADMPMPPWVLLLIQLAAVPVAAIVPNGLLAAGEEIGWRGYLTPALMPLGRVPMVLISGVIWGLWHAPLVLLGYNFGTTSWWGPAAMVGGCTTVGALLAWVRLRTGSVWPAAVGHGAMNASAAVVFLISAVDPEPDVLFAHPFGASGWIVFGLTAVALLIWGAWHPQRGEI